MSNKFIEKAFSDKEMIDNLTKFKTINWYKLSEDEKIKVCVNIGKRINSFFPELGECKFSFFVSNKKNAGNSDDDLVSVNLDSASDKGNQFYILTTILHEVRHFYQNMARIMYDRDGVVHEIFDREDFMKLYVNNNVSMLCNVSNYLNYSYNDFYEYCVQPLEFDAEKFAKEFIDKMNDVIIDSVKDIELCCLAVSEFEEISDIINGNKKNLVEFSKTYELNYEDYISNNKSVFNADEVKAQKYLSLLDKIDQLDINQIYTLFIPGLWDTYNEEDKYKIINRFLKINDFSFDVEIIGDKYKINKREFIAFNSFNIVECILNEMADKEIEKIVHKKENRRLMRIEREIRTNMKCPIKEKDNPLFYNVQPYMLYKKNYVMRYFYDMFRSIDEVYEKKHNYFSDFDKMVKKYDVKSIMKKVEILTGEDFFTVYEKMLKGMKNNKTRR